MCEKEGESLAADRHSSLPCALNCLSVAKILSFAFTAAQGPSSFVAKQTVQSPCCYWNEKPLSLVACQNRAVKVLLPHKRRRQTKCTLYCTLQPPTDRRQCNLRPPNPRPTPTRKRGGASHPLPTTTMGWARELQGEMEEGRRRLFVQNFSATSSPSPFLAANFGFPSSSRGAGIVPKITIFVSCHCAKNVCCHSAKSLLVFKLSVCQNFSNLSVCQNNS